MSIRPLSASPVRSLASLLVGSALAVAAGCASSGTGPSDSGGSATAGSMSASGSGGAVSDREWVERNYLATPAVASRLGYRIDWQNQGDPGTSITSVRAFGDSVFGLDALLRISRYDGTDGTRLWRVPMLDSVSETYGMTYLPADDALFVTTGSEFHVYDGGTGVLNDRQELLRSANTEPIPAGRFLVYGSRDGMVVWHAFQVGATWRSYRIAGTVDVAPVISEGFIVAPGRGGTVSCIRLGNASRVWTKSTLADIVASPAAGGGLTYIASLDQHLRAWPLSFDRTTPSWEYLTKAPLEDSPTLIGDSVYQRVPGHGLHCFEANPRNRPNGLLKWSSSSVTGNVAARAGDRLLVWDADRSTMQIVDERTGDLIDTIELPRVESVHVTDIEGGDIYFGGTGGRVLRLVPAAS